MTKVILIVIMAAIYVVSVIATYKVTRRWHFVTDTDPEIIDLLIVIIPAMNVMHTAILWTQLDGGKFARKVFRMGEKESDS